jgi:hypothetical protein
LYWSLTRANQSRKGNDLPLPPHADGKAPASTKGMARQGLICAGIVAAASLAAGGCSNASAPVLPTLPEIAEALSLNQDEVVGSPTEVYSRVARGAMSCWFGSRGPLKDGYIYHAQAEPASRGGKSEIVIHERDRQSENQKGLRAFRVVITPNNETASVDVETLKLPDRLANSMENDVRRWAAGAIGCTESKEQWSPRPPEPQEDPETWQSRTRKGRRT